MKNILKKYIMNIAWIVLFASIALYFSLKGDFISVLDIVKSAKINWIIVAIVLIMLYQILEGLILYIFAKLYNKDYTLKQGCVNAFTATFFNGITPFQSGGQFAQVYVFNKQKVPPSLSASILLMNFIVYQSTVVLYTFVIVATKFKYYTENYSSFFSLALIGFGISFAVICGLFLGAKSKFLQDFFVKVVLKLGAKLHIVKDYEMSSIKCKRHLEDFRHELINLSKNKNIIVFGAVTNTIKLTMLYAIPYFCAKALNIQLDLSQMIDCIGVCAFVYMITAFVPIPGASGGSEGVFVIMFSFLLDDIGAKSTMLVWRFITYYLVMLIGALVFALNKEINRKE